MLNFFRSNKKFEPLDYDSRKYFENNLLWLCQEFPEPTLEERKVLIPTSEDFPIEWNASEQNAFDVLEIICKNMQINSKNIEVDFYENGLKEIGYGGNRIFLEPDPENSEAAGYYHETNKNGKSYISLDSALLENPENLIATISHELCHVKLLGEKNLEDNDEILTDLATVFFGMGIFNANAAFQFQSNSDSWGYSSHGYLKIQEWGYALALFTFSRNEDNPVWSEFLNKSIKDDFEKCLKYLLENESEIFQFKD